MLTWEENIDAQALRKRNWTISAIARHLGRDRKTIRAYLAGDRTPGQRTPAGPDGFAVFTDYVSARLGEDPHLWATTLFDELLDLGFTGSYPTLTRQIRQRGLRPVCADCARVSDRAAAVIEHPPGDEIQWDWVDLPDAPAHWGWGTTARLLVGVLAHSGQWRGLLLESQTQPHLIDGIDRICRALGGTARAWRFDRMTTVCHPGDGKVTASFAAVATHYGVQVRICPPRRGNRKGVVEKSVQIAAQRWWGTLPDEVSVEAAQARLDTWCSTRGDTRKRRDQHGWSTVAVMAAAEPLVALAGLAPYPAVITVSRTVSAQALVSYAGNRYSVPPELAGATVAVQIRLGATHLDILTPTAGPVPTVIARHRLAAAGTGATVRDHGHVVALNHAAMTAGSPSKPHHRKQRIPPGAASLAAAKHLRAARSTDPDPDVVIDLGVYARAAATRTTITDPHPSGT